MDWPPAYEYFNLNSRFQTQIIVGEVPIVSLSVIFAHLITIGIVNALLLIIIHKISFSLFPLSLTVQGIVKALQEYQKKLLEHKVQIYVRRGGPNYQEGLRVMREVGKKGNWLTCGVTYVYMSNLTCSWQLRSVCC